MTGQEQENSPGGMGAVGTGAEPGTGAVSGTGAEPGTGGAPTEGMAGEAATGGSEATSCEIEKPPQTYLCAGTAHDDTRAGLRTTFLYPEHPDYACDRYPDWYYYDYYGDYDYYYYWDRYSEDYSDDEEGMAGAAGASMGGSAAGGAAYGGYGGTGAGGIVAVGGMPWPGTGGFGTGGGGPDPVPRSDWCEDVAPGLRIVGTTYAVGECQDTELRLPLRIEEPYGWYELTVYGGTEPCDRDEVITKTAGFGSGDILELPVDFGDAEFLSIEMQTEDWGSVTIALAEPNPAN